MRKQFHKYWVLLAMVWQMDLAYRTSFVIWRFRNFLSSLISLTVWSVIFAGNHQLFGYSQSQMITYVFIVSFLQSVILSSAQNGLASVIYSGGISQHLLRPINLIGYFMTEDLSDKLQNIGFVLVESVILFFIFHPQLAIPAWGILPIFGLWVLLGVILNFIIGILFGTIGFWSSDDWGPRFLFFMFVEYTSGKFYPLDILPAAIRNFFYLTPFPYLSYVQTRLFLGFFNSSQILMMTGVMVGWVVLLGSITSVIWRRGIRSYTAAGQ